ncbi:MAG TPA: helix-turn-helix transcriptional regulator [Rhizomicrobium sp.]|nr:helix-turn-helix transcriptional regulator [Rhizomicrobium sp.]
MFREADDKDYDVLLVENRFISDVQLVIERALEAQSVTQAELARRLDVSEARVSQMLADNGKNLQARTIARIARVLGLEARIAFETAAASRLLGGERVPASVEFDAWVQSIQAPRKLVWDMPCNDDEVLEAA